LRQIEEQIPLLRSRIRAASIGFQDPEIRRVTLAAQQSFRVVRPPDLDLTYTILDVSAGQIRMELRATTSRAAVGPRQLVIPLDPRAPTRIPTPIPGMPVLHIAVIERPAPNEAIFAIGPVAAAERS
jgi:hypothetical protein